MLECPICHQNCETDMQAEEVAKYILAQEVASHSAVLTDHIVEKVLKELNWQKMKATEENVKNTFYRLFC